MIFIYQTLGLLLGIALDLLIKADTPRWLRHLIDRHIQLVEPRFYPEFPGQQALIRSGRWITIFVTLHTLCLSSVLLYFSYEYLPYIGVLLEGVIVWQVLRVRYGWSSAKTIANDLADDDLFAARLHLSYVFPNDTSQLTSEEISAKTVNLIKQDIASNMVGPLFYFFFLGGPGALTFASIKQLHGRHDVPDDRYRFFGKAAIRTNYIVMHIPQAIGKWFFNLTGKLSHHERKQNMSTPRAGKTIQYAITSSKLTFLFSVAITLVLKIVLTLLLYII